MPTYPSPGDLSPADRAALLAERAELDEFLLARVRPSADLASLFARFAAREAALLGRPTTVPAPTKPRRQRKPSISKMIAAAERGGKTVTSITTPDGVTLHFGKVEPTEANNPWLAGIDDKVDQAMTRLHRLRYVQAFVDRKTGAVFRYFRRPGFPRVRLPGLPGSAEFMAAYQAALDAQHFEVGATKRSKPGSLSAAIAGYYTSLEFRSLAANTQAARRSVLERFRALHGDKPLAMLPQKFIAHELSKMKPHVAHNFSRPFAR